MTEVEEHTDQLARLWQWFADSFLPDYSPLYRAIATHVVGDADVLALVRAAPPEAHLPLVLLAAVHYLVLGGADHPLADVYAGRSDAEVGPLFRDLCLSRRDEVLAVMAHRRVQTNEVARSALIGPPLTLVSRTFGRPVHVIDVGASAGLNLCCDRYLLDYGELGRSGPEDSAVHIACAVRGGVPPIADRLGPFASRVGIDLDPPDLRDPDDVRWLLACVWPDTGRLERARAAMAVARAGPPTVLRGDALDRLPDVFDRLGSDGIACVLTTWSYSYLSAEQRLSFVELLAHEGRHRPVVWIAGDGPGVVDAVEVSADGPGDGEVLSAVTFEAGSTDARVLARVHPHGLWMDWLA
jgi:hypothetical protein